MARTDKLDKGKVTKKPKKNDGVSCDPGGYVDASISILGASASVAQAAFVRVDIEFECTETRDIQGDAWLLEGK